VNREHAAAFCSRLTKGYIALMLTLFPFFVLGDYTEIAHGKYLLFLSLCGGYVLLMAVPALLVQRGEWRGLSPAEKWALVYLGWTVLSALFSDYTGVWLGNGRKEGVLTIAIYVLSFLFVSHFAKVDRWQMDALSVSIGAYSFICLLQIGGNNPFGLYPGELSFADAGEAYGGSYIGMMGNAALTGAWLSLGVPLLFAAVLLLRGRRRILPAAAAAAGAATVAQMGIAAAVVGVGGAALAVPIFLQAKKNKRKHNVAAAVCLIAAVLVWSWPFFGGTAEEIWGVLCGNGADYMGSGRIGIWRQLLDIVPHQLWFGSGVDTVGQLGLALFEGTGSAGQTILRGVDIAHNEYLNILVCQGLPALIAYLFLLSSLLAGWRRENSAAAQMLRCGILGYCLQAFFSFSMYITAPLFWLALGLLSSQQKEDHLKRDGPFVC